MTSKRTHTSLSGGRLVEGLCRRLGPEGSSGRSVPTRKDEVECSYGPSDRSTTDQLSDEDFGTCRGQEDRETFKVVGHRCKVRFYSTKTLVPGRTERITRHSPKVKLERGLVARGVVLPVSTRHFKGHYLGVYEGRGRKSVVEVRVGGRSVVHCLWVSVLPSHPRPDVRGFRVRVLAVAGPSCSSDCKSTPPCCVLGKDQYPRCRPESELRTGLNCGTYLVLEKSISLPLV